MADRDWTAGLPQHEVEALSRTACDYADELLPCTCGGGDAAPCHHVLGCLARFRGAVAAALCEARTYDRRHGAGETALHAEVIRSARAVRREELAKPLSADRYVTALNVFRATVDRLEGRHPDTCDCDGTAILDGEPCPFGEWTGDEGPVPGCSNCGQPLALHCKIHVVPCCPGRCTKATDEPYPPTTTGGVHA